jgi:hypothetical protein
LQIIIFAKYALIGVQETIQATKDITNGDITNGAIVIAGAINCIYFTRIMGLIYDCSLINS